MNIEQIGNAAIEVHGHIYYQMSKKDDEKTFINKDIVLAIMDRWKKIIVKSGKTELGDNIYYMNIVDNSVKTVDLMLSQEHLERVFILEEGNKDSVKIIANSNLMCAAIKMSMQKNIDGKKSNVPIYLNVNGLYSTLEKIFKDNKQDFKNMFSVDDISFEKKNADANIVGTLTVKINKSKNALDEAKRVQDYLLNCMVMLFNNLSSTGRYENIEELCISYLEKSILKQDLDILNIGKENVKGKTLKF